MVQDRALAFMSRLAALVPAPRLHLVRYHGLLAPRSRHRRQVIPPPPGAPPTGGTQEAAPPVPVVMAPPVPQLPPAPEARPPAAPPEAARPPPTPFMPPGPAEWSVYHASNLRRGGDHCQSLSECLGKLKRWRDAHLDHEVVTLWVELKDDWDETNGHGPSDLDGGRLEKDLPGALFRPIDLLAACPGVTTLSQAARGPCAWPTLEQLRSKFIVVLMGDNDREQVYLTHVNHYRPGGSDRYRTSFVAPEVGGPCHAALEKWPDAIFFNIHNSDGLATADCVFGAGLVSRIWLIGGTEEWTAARASRGHHLATDEVMTDVRTHARRGRVRATFRGDRSRKLGSWLR